MTAVQGSDSHNIRVREAELALATAQMDAVRAQEENALAIADAQRALVEVLREVSAEESRWPRRLRRALRRMFGRT